MSDVDDFRKIIGAWARRRNPTEAFTLNQIANFARCKLTTVTIAALAKVNAEEVESPPHPRGVL